EQFQTCASFTKSLNLNRRAEIHQNEVISAICEYRLKGTVCRMGAIMIFMNNRLVKLTIKKRDGSYVYIKDVTLCLLLYMHNLVINIIVIQFPQFADFFQVEAVVFLLVDGQLKVVLSVQFAIMHFDGKQWMLIAIVISYNQHLITYHSDTLKGLITAF